MKINWFPGHMNKALTQMSEEIKKIDVIIYVLDSRAPLSCINPSFDKILENKPVLYVINKCDLVDKKDVDYYISYFRNLNKKCISLDSTMSGSAKKITEEIKILCKDRIQKFSNKNIKIILRAMVIGVPNCGKSTLINNLSGYAKTITGNKPGVTKGKQWIKIDEYLEVLDTPGTLYPNLANPVIARNLALINSIRDQVLDLNELALEFIDYLKTNNSNSLINRYGVSVDKNNIEILEDIALKRMFVIKGGEIDYDKGSFALIDDFRKGRLGKIVLDKNV